jgi:hypothetical protein
VGAIPGKLFTLFTEKYTLKLADSSTYGEVVGRGVPDIANIAGRGYTRVGRIPLEFQIALPIGQDESGLQQADENEKLVSLAVKMKQTWGNAWKNKPPATIEILPLRVALENVIKGYRPPAKRVVSILGINDQDLQPYVLDLQRQGPHFIILGPPNSGKTTFLRTILLSIATIHSPKEVNLVLVDFQRKLFDYGGKHNLGELPHVIQTMNRPDQLAEFILKLKTEVKDFAANPGRPKIVVLIDNYDSFSDDGNRAVRTGFEELGVICREYSTSGLSFVAAGSLAITSAMEDLRKQITSSSLGAALQTADAVNKLNGKISRSLAEAELPIGRGFMIKSGRTTMLQAATPYSSDDNVEGSLDTWVEQILKAYPGPQPEWIYKPEPPAEDNGDGTKKDDGKTTSTAAKQPNGKSPSISPQKLEELKKFLLEKGMIESMLALLSPDDIVNMAASYEVKPSEAAK